MSSFKSKLIYSSDQDYYKDEKFTKKTKRKRNKNGKDKRKWRQKRKEKRSYE